MTIYLYTYLHTYEVDKRLQDSYIRSHGYRPISVAFSTQLREYHHQYYQKSGGGNEYVCIINCPNFKAVSFKC